MVIQELIDTISALYPVDASYPDTRAVGERLLMEAIRQSDWRDLPPDILALYAAKCEREEARQANLAAHRSSY